MSMSFVKAAKFDADFSSDMKHQPRNDTEINPEVILQVFTVRPVEISAEPLRFTEKLRSITNIFIIIGFFDEEKGNGRRNQLIKLFIRFHCSFWIIYVIIATTIVFLTPNTIYANFAKLNTFTETVKQILLITLTTLIMCYGLIATIWKATFTEKIKLFDYEMRKIGCEYKEKYSAYVYPFAQCFVLMFITAIKTVDNVVRTKTVRIQDCNKFIYYSFIEISLTRYIVILILLYRRFRHFNECIMRYSAQKKVSNLCSTRTKFLYCTLLDALEEFIRHITPFLFLWFVLTVLTIFIDLYYFIEGGDYTSLFNIIVWAIHIGGVCGITQMMTDEANRVNRYIINSVALMNDDIYIEERINCALTFQGSNIKVTLMEMFNIDINFLLNFIGLLITRILLAIYTS